VQEWVSATLEAKIMDVPHVVVNASVDIRCLRSMFISTLLLCEWQTAPES